MNKYKFYIFWFIFISILSLIFYVNLEFENNIKDNICIKWNCFFVEISKTDQQRKIWLMNRTYLWEKNWMLFVFEEQWKHFFWMKNTLIPLDIIWLDKDLKIVYIEKNAQPCKTQNCESYWPKNYDTKYVLEINWWMSDKLWLKIGEYFDKFLLKISKK